MSDLEDVAREVLETDKILELGRRINTLAMVVAVYYNGLIAVGMSEENALFLTCNIQSELLGEVEL